MSYLVSFCSCIFIPFSIAIASLVEERANLSAFRAFARFVLVRICRFPLPFFCLVRAAVCDCGTPLTFLLLFFSKGVFGTLLCKWHETIQSILCIFI